MMVDTSATLKISVWRDFIPNRVIVLSDESDSSRQVLTSDSNLQEEVYSWHLREDALAGVSDENIRRRLREGLQRLDASRPPSERRVSVLEDFLAEVKHAIESGDAKPVASRNPPSEEEETGFNSINALLALFLHLKWLSRCLAKRPGISISVR